MQNIKVVKHPLIHKLITNLRDINTDSQLFRIYSRQLATFLLYEALSDLSTEEHEVETQTGLKYKGVCFSKKVAFICILRAAIGMLSTAMELFEGAEFHTVGIKRNETDPYHKEPNFYLDRLNELGKDVEEIVLVDPMLATGSSIITVIRRLREVHGFKGNIRVVCFIAAKPGVEKIVEIYPDTKLTAAGLDDRLNDKAFIIPGLGDAGDRFFGIDTDLSTVR